MQIDIPQRLRPADGRFGSGPAKVRREALEHLLASADVMGTSHRQAPVRGLVADLQEGLADLYRLPEGYEVTLGNGGATAFWDVAVFSLIAERSAHGVFGEFSRKFARASAAAPFLGEPAVFEAEPGSVALPQACEADTFCWAQNETSTGASAPVHRIGDGLVLVDATSAAGGIILFIIGLRMIFPSPHGLMGDLPDGEPFIVPMAIPMIAGPSCMAAVMLLGSQEPNRMGDWTLALVSAWVVTAVILFSATYLERLLGARVLTAIERLMGMVIVAISVQMLMDGVVSFLRIAS